MKKLIIIILAVIVTLPTYSQDNESGDVKSKFYIRAGLSMPTWTYFGYKNETDLKKCLGAESRIGGIFEIGKIYMLNGINIGDGMRLGINADFVSLKTHIFALEGGDNIYSGFAGSKIGPSFTYSINKAIAFDIFAKINPVWAAAVYKNNQSIEGVEDLNVYYGYVQMMYSFGFNVKLAIVMLGVEYDIGSLKLKNSEGTYYNPAGTDNDKNPMEGFNVTIGITF